MVSYPETSNARIKKRNKQLNKGDWHIWLVPPGGWGVRRKLMLATFGIYCVRVLKLNLYTRFRREHYAGIRKSCAYLYWRALLLLVCLQKKC